MTTDLNQPMNLDPRSILYRAGERVLRFGWVLVLLVLSGSSEVSDVVGISPGGPALVVGVVVAGLAVLLGWQVAVYRRFSYAVTADTVDIRSGVFSRREREIPLHRIQNVDTNQNLAQRALGIVDVSLETAGGGATEARLRYLSSESARRLREDLRQRKRERDREANASEGDTPSTGIDDESEADYTPTELFAIQPRELALLGLVSIDLRVLSLATIGLPILAPAFATMIGSRGVPVGPAGAFVLAPLSAAAFVVLSGLVSGAYQASNYYDFRLLRAGNDLQYERGLLQRSEGTIPTGKIQALAIEENLLARLTGYATLSVETAGYAPGQGPSGGSAAAVPLTTRERCLTLARSIEPVSVPAFRRPPKRTRTRYVFRYAGVVALLAGLAWGVTRFFDVPVPWYAALAVLAGLVVVPVAAHLKWANRGYALAEGYVLTRNGFWTRTTAIVPDYRVQTVIETRNVFQRRRQLATLTVDTAGAGGSRVARAVDIDRDVATDLRETVADRLQEALAARRAGRDKRGAAGDERAGPTGRPAGGNEPLEATGTEADDDVGAAEDVGTAEDTGSAGDGDNEADDGTASAGTTETANSDDAAIGGEHDQDERDERDDRNDSDAGDSDDDGPTDDRSDEHGATDRGNDGEGDDDPTDSTGNPSGSRGNNRDDRDGRRDAG